METRILLCDSENKNWSTEILFFSSQSEAMAHPINLQENFTGMFYSKRNNDKEDERYRFRSLLVG